MYNSLNTFESLTELIIDDKIIDDHFNNIKNIISIPAKVNKHQFLGNILTVTMQINICEFNSWIEINYPAGIFYIRSLWNKFSDYVKNIINYGYHFNNIDKINRFLPKNKFKISPADNIIKQFKSYNICNAAEIENFKLSSDKNNIEFDIIAEAYYKSDPDDTINKNNTLILPLHDIHELDQFLTNLNTYNDKTSNGKDNIDKNISIEDKENKEDENDIDIKDEDETDKETKKEKEMQKLLDQYNIDGIIHSNIANAVLCQKRDNLSDIDYIAYLGIQPKIVSHIKKDHNILALKFVLTKRIFSQNYLSLRPDKDVNNAWEKLKTYLVSTQNNIFSINNINTYISENNFILDNIINKIYDIKIKDTSILFFINIKVKK